MTLRPEVAGYTIDNQVKTVAQDGKLNLQIAADESGRKFEIQGTIPLGQKDIIRTMGIKDPKSFARAALIQALQKEGVEVQVPSELSKNSVLPKQYDANLKMAEWTSPPLSEYGKQLR